MAPDQDLPIQTEQADAPAPAEPSRPGRRPGRGHRGRGRRRRAKAPRADSVSAEPLGTAPAEREPVPGVVVCQPPSAAPEPAVREEDAETPPSKGQLPQVSIQGAIEQVNEIVRSLKDTLEQMDEVLESLEYFERQGNADEREIESLRRSLRQLQRPREGGHHSHRGS